MAKFKYLWKTVSNHNYIHKEEQIKCGGTPATIQFGICCLPVCQNPWILKYVKLYSYLLFCYGCKTWVSHPNERTCIQDVSEYSAKGNIWMSEKWSNG